MAYKKRTTPDGKPLWMPIWATEHLADTMHLSPAEFGCLERLNLSYWRSGPPRDEDETLARICGCSVSVWKRYLPSATPCIRLAHGIAPSMSRIPVQCRCTPSSLTGRVF
jgi:hypothetical protein